MRLSARDLSFLQGCEITQIVLVTKWCVSFKFTEGHEIVVEERLEHLRSATGEVLDYFLKEGLSGPLYLHDLLERKVVSLEVADKALMLAIDNGDILTVHADSERSESGHVIGPNGFMLF